MNKPHIVKKVPSNLEQKKTPVLLITIKSFVMCSALIDILLKSNSMNVAGKRLRMSPKLL